MEKEVITESQRKALAKLRERILNYLPGKVWKEWSVEFVGKSIAVWAVVGRPNDEGTYAELYCRDKWYIFIGPRGGLRAYGKGKKAVKGWRAFYTAKR